MDFLQKPVTYSKSLVHFSKVSIYVNEHISAIRMKSPCVIVHKQDKSCCQYNSVLVLPDVNYGNSLDDSYCTEMQKAELLMYAIYPFQKYKFTHYCVWDIDWKRLFWNVWIIEDMVDLPIFSCTLQPL